MCVCDTRVIHLKMLIRKKLYSVMMCIAKSGNTILQSILNSDALKGHCIEFGVV